MLSGITKWAVFLIVASPALRADSLPAAKQTELVHHYCAVCHTDASMNGGLSLEHYDAAKPDPQLAAMLLSKLRHGAMGAAGVGVPDKPTQEAWIAATTAQAEGAKNWTVIQTGSRSTASIVREVPPRSKGDDPPVYRLTMSCDQGVRLTFSPAPQKDRAFTVTLDGRVAIQPKIEGGEQMGNGKGDMVGRAWAKLDVMPSGSILGVDDLFPGEQVDFPLSDLDPAVRKQLTGCLTTARR